MFYSWQIDEDADRGKGDGELARHKPSKVRGVRCLRSSLSWCGLYGDTPLTRHDGSNCCSMILHWLRKSKMI
jgi:hypothetical protein